MNVFIFTHDSKLMFGISKHKFVLGPSHPRTCLFGLTDIYTCTPQSRFEFRNLYAQLTEHLIILLLRLIFFQKLGFYGNLRA